MRRPHDPPFLAPPPNPPHAHRTSRGTRGLWMRADVREGAVNVVDLFAGAGGWDIGARRLGVDPLGIELDPAACLTREANGLRTLRADVALLDPAQFPCDVLIASPPCQSFSSAGKGEGRRALDRILSAVDDLAHGRGDTLSAGSLDERSRLVLEPLRWALALRPRVVVLEQVRQVLPVWDAIAGVLRRVGYSAVAGVLSAECYGVPQTRARAFMVARLDGPAVLPAATHRRYRKGVGQHEGDAGLRPWVSMAEALGDRLPWLVGTQMNGDTGEYSRRHLTEPALTVVSNANRWHWARDPRIAAPGWHDPTVSGSQYGPETVRVTIEEAAVLQTFPTGFRVIGNAGECFRAIGNAIPPLLAEHVLDAALGHRQELAA